MQRQYTTDFLSSSFNPEIYDDVARDLETESRLEMRKLSDLAWVFLLATDNDSDAAAELMNRSIDLICEGGVLHMWRYRAVLTKIREGL
jgi:hypothetical protein